MGTNLKKFIGTGLSPEQFMAGMTRNQDACKDWYNQFAWQEEQENVFKSLHKERLHCLIIAADWCGDVVRNVPVVFRLTEAASIPTEVLIMEENLDLIDQFLTFGGRSIPVVLFVTSDGEVVGRWGPRPTYIQAPMAEFKTNYTDKSAPDYEENLKATRQEIMRRYGTDTAYQKLIANEVQQVLSGI